MASSVSQPAARIAAPISGAARAHTSAASRTSISHRALETAVDQLDQHERSLKTLLEKTKQNRTSSSEDLLHIQHHINMIQRHSTAVANIAASVNDLHKSIIQRM